MARGESASSASGDGGVLLVCGLCSQLVDESIAMEDPGVRAFLIHLLGVANDDLPAKTCTECFQESTKTRTFADRCLRTMAKLKKVKDSNVLGRSAKDRKVIKALAAEVAEAAALPSMADEKKPPGPKKEEHEDYEAAEDEAEIPVGNRRASNGTRKASVRDRRSASNADAKPKAVVDSPAAGKRATRNATNDDIVVIDEDDDSGPSRKSRTSRKSRDAPVENGSTSPPPSASRSRRGAAAADSTSKALSGAEIKKRFSKRNQPKVVISAREKAIAEEAYNSEDRTVICSKKRLSALEKPTFRVQAKIGPSSAKPTTGPASRKRRASTAATATPDDGDDDPLSSYATPSKRVKRQQVKQEEEEKPEENGASRRASLGRSARKAKKTPVEAETETITIDDDDPLEVTSPPPGRKRNSRSTPPSQKPKARGPKSARQKKAEAAANSEDDAVEEPSSGAASPKRPEPKGRKSSLSSGRKNDYYYVDGNGTTMDSDRSAAATTEPKAAATNGVDDLDEVGDDEVEVFPSIGPYQCEICQAITNTKQDFVEHIKKNHRNIVDEEVLRSLEHDLKISKKKAAAAAGSALPKGRGKASKKQMQRAKLEMEAKLKAIRHRYLPGKKGRPPTGRPRGRPPKIGAALSLRQPHPSRSSHRHPLARKTVAALSTYVPDQDAAPTYAPLSLPPRRDEAVQDREEFVDAAFPIPERRPSQSSAAGSTTALDGKSEFETQELVSYQSTDNSDAPITGHDSILAAVAEPFSDPMAPIPIDDNAQSDFYLPNPVEPGPGSSAVVAPPVEPNYAVGTPAVVTTVDEATGNTFTDMSNATPSNFEMFSPVVEQFFPLEQPSAQQAELDISGIEIPVENQDCLNLF